MKALNELVVAANRKYDWYKLLISRYEALGGTYFHVQVLETQKDGSPGIHMHGAYDKDLAKAIRKVIGGLNGSG